MKELHSLCVDKASCKAERGNNRLLVHMLTKDSFKKAYQEKLVRAAKQ